MVTSTRRVLVLVLSIVTLAAVSCERAPLSQPPASEITVRVAVASSARPALAAVVDEFAKRHTGVRIDLVGGSTAALGGQLRAGAPFDVFYAADLATPNALVRDGVLDGDTVAVYARGELVLWLRGEAGVSPSTADDRTLRDPSIRRLALADERTAPYGRAARQVLARVTPHRDVVVVTGESVEQAAQFASTGAVDAAFLSRSHADSVSRGGGHILAIDPDWYEPLVHAGGVATRSHGAVSQAARVFHAFVLSAEGQRIIGHFGFLVAGEGEGR